MALDSHRLEEEGSAGLSADSAEWKFAAWNAQFEVKRWRSETSKPLAGKKPPPAQREKERE